MEIIGKYLLMFLITLLFKWIFATCFHFAAKNICENYSEPDSNQMYIFLKYLSWFLFLTSQGVIHKFAFQYRDNIEPLAYPHR